MKGRKKGTVGDPGVAGAPVWLPGCDDFAVIPENNICLQKGRPMRAFIKRCFPLLLVLFFFHPPGVESTLFLSEKPLKAQSKKHGRGGSHSEHRALPKRTYYLSTEALSGNSEIHVFRPDGSRGGAERQCCQDGNALAVDTRPLDASSDGVFLVYVLDRSVQDETLVVRVAKRNLLNHSCRWGHEYKFDSERLRPKSRDEIPLDITAEPLWDKNFHSRTMSGDTLEIQVLRHGTPVEGARVNLRTEKGWIKTFRTDTNGAASVQLIRDYYPSAWSAFRKNRKGDFLITAEVAYDENGVLDGLPYRRVHMTATLPWKYAPQRGQYQSYAYGLSIASAFLLVSGLGIFLYRERRKRPYREVHYDEKD